MSEIDLVYDIEKFFECIVKFFGGVVVIKVGVVIEIEFEDRKLRIEDVKNVIFVVIEEGIVFGGGVVLVYLFVLVLVIKEIIDDFEEKIGVDIV